MDNSAGRSFLLRSGVGRIVPSRENPADLGTKRLAKDRMEYLMCLCKVYNIDTSEFVGINAYDKVQEQGNLKASIFFSSSAADSAQRLGPLCEK